MRRSQLVIFAGLSFMVGILLLANLPVHWQYFDLLYFGLSLFCLSFIFIDNKYCKHVKIIAIVGCCLFLGMFRLSLAFNFSGDDLMEYHEQTVIMQGYVSGEVAVRVSKQQFVFDVERIDEQTLQGRALISTGLLPVYEYGQELIVECKLQAPFNESYGNYLVLDNIYTTCYYPGITVLALGGKRNSGWQGSGLKQYLIGLRQNWQMIIQQTLRPPIDAMAEASLLGYKQSLFSEVKEVLSRSGLSHLMAISGLHISIISLIILSLLLWLTIARPTAFYITSILLWSYIILIGAPASALRAGIMGWLVLWAVYLGRLNRSLNALVIAGVVMLLWQPQAILYDIGWQLSFTAVLGIIYIYPILKYYLKFIKYKIVQDIIAISLSAQLAVWPLVAWHFDQFSIVGLLANLLVIWLLPVIMISLILGIGLTWLMPGLGIYWMIPANLGLSYVWLIAKNMSDLSYSAVTIDLPWWLLVGYYLLLIVVIIWLTKKNESLSR